MKSLIGIWMDDARTWEMSSGETLRPRPGPTLATALAAASKHTKPKASYLVHKTADAVAVARDGVIVQPPLHNTP